MCSTLHVHVQSGHGDNVQAICYLLQAVSIYTLSATIPWKPLTSSCSILHQKHSHINAELQKIQASTSNILRRNFYDTQTA